MYNLWANEVCWSVESSNIFTSCWRKARLYERLTLSSEYKWWFKLRTSPCSLNPRITESVGGCDGGNSEVVDSLVFGFSDWLFWIQNSRKIISFSLR